ncbi:MAG: ferritin-like domain-containing protein [Candidatus Omnitrophica bacterium]|nr:ferritin-like domain-containing protein [Candidatus Omnitrophota bacterium]MDD5552255.1 ferritin-like domain-containing protein [Candidatus Omnitrophota bacterium]
MADLKKELVEMLNKALELEHAARIQYLAHAQLVEGINAEKIVERLEEIASDEDKHEKKFRNLIGAYLGGEPSMGISETRTARKIEDILQANLEQEKEAIDFYKGIYRKVNENKDSLHYEFETLEHDLRHIIIDEEEHVIELSLLLGL